MQSQALLSKWLKYVLQFILGGGIIVGITVLTEHVDPKYAAFLYSLPVQFTVAAVFIHFGSESTAISSLASESLFYISTLLVFIAVFYITFKYLSFWQTLGVSYLFYMVMLGTLLWFL